MSQNGLIVKAYGRQFIVEVDGIDYQAVTKGKQTKFVVGDAVSVDIINQEQVQIVNLAPRRNLIYRTDMHKSKIIASNVDQILIVISVKPNCNLNFLNACLIFAASEQIAPLIVLNKTDLSESTEFYNQIEALYQNQLGYKVVKLAAISECDNLVPLLADKSNLLIGQSGVGKSTIVNQLIPHTNTRVGVITKSENSGCHTTTNATLYHLNNNTIIIDCPGLQEFGLYHLNVNDLIYYFPELNEAVDKCKFRNCRHINEPGCAVTMLYKAGELNELRYNLFQSLTHSLLQKANY